MTWLRFRSTDHPFAGKSSGAGPATAATALRVALALAILILAAWPLAACGKRQGDLDPPKDAQKQYPRQYPAW
jgi:hypothetical protein